MVRGRPHAAIVLRVLRMLIEEPPIRQNTTSDAAGGDWAKLVSQPC